MIYIFTRIVDTSFLFANNIAHFPRHSTTNRVMFKEWHKSLNKICFI